jgi:hypothetical protein
MISFISKRIITINILFKIFILPFFFSLASCSKELAFYNKISTSEAHINNESINLITIKDVLLNVYNNGKPFKLYNSIINTGKPIWEKVLIVNKNTNPEYIIPFKKDKNEISGIVAIKHISGKLYYRFIEIIPETNIADDKILKDLALIKYMNNYVFGKKEVYDSITVLNSKQNNKISFIYNKNELQTNQLTYQTYSSTWDFVEICITTSTNCTCSPDEPKCDMCPECVTTKCWGSWVNIEDELLDPINSGSGAGSGITGGYYGGSGSGSSLTSFEIIPDPNILENYYDDPLVFEEDLTPLTFNYSTDIWPIINNVIPTFLFVGYDSRNCLTLAKEQIAKVGLRDLGYGSSFKIFNLQGGPYSSVAKQGVNYIITKLKQGKPVIVGVSNKAGVVSPLNLDGKTNHFVTIVGTGQDEKGRYFVFYDNSSNLPQQGTNPSNKLYYNQTTGLIKGRSQTTYGLSVSEYEVTQVRMNK